MKAYVGIVKLEKVLKHALFKNITETFLYNQPKFYLFNPLIKGQFALWNLWYSGLLRSSYAKFWGGIFCQPTG